MNDIGFTEVQQICAAHGIEITDCKAITGSFGKKIFMLNHEFLLRVSETSMALEQEKFRRIAALSHVPKIIHTGDFPREAGTIYYTLLTLLPGDDFVDAYPQASQAQQKQLGLDTAQFLDGLHAIDGTRYDIGLYVPAVPGFSGTWREGHQRYWDRLKQDGGKIPLLPDSPPVFERAFQYLQETGSALEYQTGPVLLHNDFHPMNILLDRGRFSGVIDWECSQFGEADFDLCHLIHWCVYPPKPGIDFRPFLRGLFEAAPRCTRVPQLARRLTIYQVEHELQQIIWNAREAEAVRVPRLTRWMDGWVDRLLRETGYAPEAS